MDTFQGIQDLRKETRRLIRDLYKASVDGETFESVLLPIKDLTPEPLDSEVIEKPKKRFEIPAVEKKISASRKSTPRPKSRNTTAKVEEKVRFKVLLVHPESGHIE
jgi:hypothetical protein